MTFVAPTPALAEDEAAFRAAHPAYADTGVLDELRATEYARLDECGEVYLDYTGDGLYAESQLREHLALPSRNVFGNPHSCAGLLARPASSSCTLDG